MPKNNEKNFDLGTILTVTTGRLFVEIEKVYDILNYLSNDNIYAHQIPRVRKVAQSYILERYPQLEGVGKAVVVNNWEDVMVFLDSQKAILGDSFALSPMPREICEHINPIQKVKKKRLGKTR